jgi:hypothetical protein
LKTRLVIRLLFPRLDFGQVIEGSTYDDEF